MHRIDGPGATQDNRFTDGDPAAGIPPTIVTDDWANAVQEEIAGVITGAGLALNKADNGQLLQAITALGPERFRGFATSGQHEAYEADLAAIDRNSLYAVRKGVTTGLPADTPASAWAFCHTLVMPSDAARTQLLWSVDDPDHPGWWRRRAAGAWGEWKGIGAGGGGMPIGMTFWWPGTTPPAGSLAINDGPLLSRAAYPQLWAMAEASGNIITEAAWQAQAAVQSSVGAFSTGDGATTFRCPRLRDYVRGADPAGGKAVGMWLADDYKSHWHGHGDNPYGGFGTDLPTRTMGNHQSTVTAQTPRTDVSGGAETRPKTIHLLPCIKAFDAVANAGQVDMAALATSLAGKVDRTDWTQSHGSNGWQKLPSGLIIQWGAGTACSGTGGTATAITNAFPLAFPTACHVVLPVAGPTDDGLSQVVISSKSTTGFVAENGPNNTIPILYIAIGR